MSNNYKSQVDEAIASATVSKPAADVSERIKAIPAITDERRLPELPPQLISGIIYRGGKLLLAGASKAGKSHLLLELAVAVATGGRWLEFDCAKGRVLYVNLEIQEPQVMRRVYRICDAMEVDGSMVAENLMIANLRGKFSNISALVDSLVASYKPGDFDLVIVDPAYKVQSGSENEADAITSFCGQLDRLVEALECTVAYSHHHSKGGQGNKNAEDRASGSGVFARDADALIDLIELGLDEAALEARRLLRWWDAIPFRLEFVLRDFKHIDPINVWFRYPLHEVDPTGELTDTLPKKPGGNKETNAEAQKRRLEAIEEKLDEFMGDKDEVPRKEFINHTRIDTRTVNKYLNKSKKFKLESDATSAIIKRK